MTSRGVPGSQLQPQPQACSAGRGPNPGGPVGAGLRPEGRDGGLAGAPLAGRPVPGLGPHAAGIRGVGERTRRPESGRGLVPCPRPRTPRRGPGRWGRPGANLQLINGRHLLKKWAWGEEVNAEVGAAGPAAAPHTSRGDFWPRADGGGGGRGRSRRVSRVTTPMKFPIVGGGGEAAAATHFPSPAAPPAPRPSDVPPGGRLCLFRRGGAWGHRGPLRALQTIPRPQRKRGRVGERRGDLFTCKYESWPPGKAFSPHFYLESLMLPRPSCGPGGCRRVPWRRNKEIMSSRVWAPTPPRPEEGRAACVHSPVGSAQEGAREGEAARSTRDLSPGRDLGSGPGAAANRLPLWAAPYPLRACVSPPVK